MNHTFPSLDSLLIGETTGIEYKVDIDAKNKRGPYCDDAIAESLMSISNQQGGYLLLGVDNKGKITGVNPERDGRLALLRNRAARKFIREPALSIQKYDDPRGKVIVFHIDAANLPLINCRAAYSKSERTLARSKGLKTFRFL